MLLGLSLGIAYFTWLVTGLATGLGLAITLIGIPLLTLVLASVRPLLAVERALSNTLLGSEIPRAGLAPAATACWGSSRRTGPTRRRGAASRICSRASPSACSRSPSRSPRTRTALYLIAAPVVAPFDTIELGVWQPDTWFEGVALVPLGVAALVAAGWISEGMAAMSRGLARWGAA